MFLTDKTTGQAEVSTVTSVAVLTKNITHNRRLVRSEMELACEDFEHQLEYISNLLDCARPPTDFTQSSLETEILSGVRTSILGQLLEPAYNACNMEYGKGSDRRRKDIIAAYCRDRQLFNSHRRRSTEKFSALINELQERINNAIATHVTAIQQDIAIVEEEHVVTEAERIPEFRGRLGKEVSDARKLLGNLISGIQ